MSTELRLSIFSSKREVQMIPEVTGFEVKELGSSLRMSAHHADVSEALSRVLEALGEKLGGDCLIKVQVHERSASFLQTSVKRGAAGMSQASHSAAVECSPSRSLRQQDVRASA